MEMDPTPSLTRSPYVRKLKPNIYRQEGKEQIVPGNAESALDFRAPIATQTSIVHHQRSSRRSVNAVAVKRPRPPLMAATPAAPPLTTTFSCTKFGPQLISTICAACP